MGIKMILIDVDDCALPTDGNVSSEFYQGLEQISKFVKRANEGEFPQLGFCTGRDRNYVEAVSFFTGLPDSWSIIESGIALFNPTTKELVLNPALTTETKTAFETIRKERLPQILEKFPGLFDYPGNMINIALERRYGVNTSIEECFRVVETELKDLIAQGLITIHHSKIAVDISPADIDKASGVRFFAEKTGVDPSQILGIGDSRGDFPMLRLVKWVGCPQNASEECKQLVKDKGGYISPLKHANGVSDVIRHFIKEG